jgi:hypothetical protein
VPTVEAGSVAQRWTSNAEVAPYKAAALGVQATGKPVSDVSVYRTARRPQIYQVSIAVRRGSVNHKIVG